MSQHKVTTSITDSICNEPANRISNPHVAMLSIHFSLDYFSDAYFLTENRR